MAEIKTTGSLTELLQKAKPSDISSFLEENAESLLQGEKPFAAYMRERFHEKKLRRQDVFLQADIPEGYGYKLISEEKHTVQRDVILRICLAGQFSLQETQTALRLYGMTPLYAKIPRDAVLIVAINQHTYEMEAIDAMLQEQGMKPLYCCKGTEE